MSSANSQISVLYSAGYPATLREVYLITDGGDFGFLTELREVDSDNVMLNEISVKSILRDILHVGVSTGALAISGGVGGDTITDAIFAMQSAAGVMEKVTTIASSSQELGQALGNLQGLSITAGTETIYKKVEKVILGIIRVAGKKGGEVIQKLKDQIGSILTKIATTVGDWVATALPDDFGLGGPVIREALKQIFDMVAEHPYDIVSGLANKVPIILNPEKLKEVFTGIVNKVVKFLGEMENPKKLSKKILKGAGKVAKTAAKGMAMIAISKAMEKMTGKDLTTIKGIKAFLDTDVRKNIPVAIKTFEMIMTLFFSVVASLQVVMQYDTGEEKEDKDAADETPDADADDVTPAETGNDQETQGDEKMAAGYRRSGQTIRELREFIHYALEES